MYLRKAFSALLIQGMLNRTRFNINNVMGPWLVKAYCNIAFFFPLTGRLALFR